jgi:AbrB family looped-hinge helix DNA binding protein
MKSKVVTVTKKGQATIPKDMREKYRVGNKVLAVDSGEGILLKPIPSPAEERGSLKGVLGKKARKILDEVRSEDVRCERRLVELSL